MVDRHSREIEGREPFATAHSGGVTIIKGGGGFTGAEMGNHDLFDEYQLAFWINSGLDESEPKPVANISDYFKKRD